MNQLQNQGWTVINNDLNAGAGGKFIYLLYKTNESSGSSSTAVTGFYLKTGNSDHPNTLTYDGHTYNLASAVGSNDLNCGAGGAYIFLYYTKEAFSPGRMVTDIYFNNNSNGALGANGNTSSGFDLNSGAGGDYIYMHVVTITTDGIIDVYTEAQLREAVMLNDANIRMMADINISSEVEINNNRSITLDLNGHTLDRGLSSSTNYGHALKVISGSTLTINDASGDNSGIIKGAYTGQGGGISNYGTIIINGGTIRDNHSSAKGGGINNHNGASLTINGGVITNNEAQDGAGIYNEATGTITINNCSIIGNTTNKYGGGGITNYGTLAFYGGTVSNNTAIQDGGGIWTDNSLTVSGVTIEGNSALNGGGICINHGTVDLTNVTISGNTSKDGGGIYVYSVGTLTFNSGSISDNTTTEYGGGGIANHGNTTIFSGSITDNTSVENGGGIWTGNTLTLKGGTITNNHAGSNTHGDGVYYYGGTFNLEGNPQIYGNLKADGQLGINVYLPSGKKFTVTGAFTEEANVFITMESPGVFTTGFKSNDSITNAFEVFIPDNLGYYVTEENGEARLTALGNRVAYIQRLWDPSTHKITAQMMTCSDFVRLEGSSSNSSTELGSGWYVVDRNVSYKSRLKIVGYDVNIILCDGATLNANGSIFIQDGMKLTVFGQSIGSGKIKAHPDSGPGIGGGYNTAAGHFVVKGGTITINGGIVTAESKLGAGIGGGYEGNAAIINITDGLVQASSKEGAGIGGGGGPGGGGGGNGGTTNISGGVVIAFSKQKGAGIGGGNDGDGGTVNISGGHVTAVGGNYDFDYWREHHEPNYLSFIKNFGGRDYHSSVLYFIADLIFSGSYGGAGIGGGSFGTLNLYEESMVQTKEGGNWVLQNVADRIHKVQHGTYAVIEPCPHESVTYFIYNDEKHSVYCNHCSHHHTEPHVINPSTGRCVCGYGVATHTVTVYQASENGNGAYASGVSNTVAHGFDFMLPSNAVNPENLEFVGWMVGTPSQVNGYEVTGGETLYAEGEAYNVTDDVAFIARYKNYWNGTGSGAGNDPFLIATTDDLIQLSNRVNAGEDYEGRFFLLVDDLVFDGTANNFIAIGNNNHRFNGTFDGNHHSITGININNSQYFQGLFGVVGQNGTVKGVTLQDCTIKGNAYSGSIVGSNLGTVERCLVFGSTVQGTECGGVVGYTNGNLRFNYYTGNNATGIGFDNHNTNVDNIFGGNKGYTISCAEGLTFDYVMGFATGSEEEAIIEHSGTYYTAEGATISFAVDSPLGYTISSLMVNGTTILPDVEGTYIFIMPAANVNITSTLVQPTFIHEGLWDDEENWSNGLPQGGSDVVVAAPALIEGVANVGHITFENGGSITIAKGGELTHSDNVTATFLKGISAYNDDSDGWFTIASPVTYNLPIATHFTTESTYDLYLYHEPTHYWWNSKNPEHDYDFTVLQYLEGYLYANAEDVTLSFEGNMMATDHTVTIPLSCYAAGGLKGYNLVGNPFTRRLTEEDVIKIGDDDLTTYLVADGGGELVPYTLVERPIEPGEGFFVQATEPGQNLVINHATRGEQTKREPAYLCIEVDKEGYYDRAYVQFDGGNALRKMKLNDDIMSVSVWHNGEDWAAATLESATDELPVHFKAKENGTYTLTVSESLNSKFLILNYLHLIDNLTGADIDLLQTPSYTFEAKFTDYESRFKLVFSVDEDNQNHNDNFAFVDVYGNLMIKGTGVVQIVDMLGHVLVYRDAKFCVSTAGMTSGVYVLRLINGDDVKTQKIVL